MNLDQALFDLWIFELKRVGRKNLTKEQLWHEWINQ